MKLLATATLVCVLFQVSCATIVNGRTQKLTIDSRPPGARAVVLPGGKTVTTPGEVKLVRGEQRYSVTLSHEGYEKKRALINRQFSGWYLGNIVFGGLVGFVLDPIVGSIWTLQPDPLIVNLKRLPAPPEALEGSAP